MNYLVNSHEMKQYDKNTIEYYGVPSLVLMERAAQAVFTEIKTRFPSRKTRALILCGAGNNGGDGFAVARMLLLEGYFVQVLFPMKEEKMTAETKKQYEILQKYHADIKKDWEETDGEYDIIIDALFGIGLSRPLTGELKEIIKKANEQNAFRLAVDIASGIEADTGAILGEAFSADVTVTFAYEKLGQYLYPGAEYSGEIITADIGISKHSFLGREPKIKYLEQASAKTLLPKRTAYSNKGSYGKALIIAGSKEMAGAAYFASKAAYLGGCGLVRIFTPEQNREILLSKLSEAILTIYPSDNEETAAERLKEAIGWSDVVLIGCGIGKGKTARRLVKEVLAQREKPLVLDADALNILSEDMTMLKNSQAEILITPHLGEMSRLTGKSVTEISEHLIETAEQFAKEYDVTCVLKDARTVIAGKDGIYLNVTGNNGMATGGSGDVLAGLLTGLFAQSFRTNTDFTSLAALACYLHGTAGDLAAKEKGTYGMLAEDILNQLPYSIRLTENQT